MYLAPLSHAQRGVHLFLIVAAPGGRPGSLPSSSGLGRTGLLQHALAKGSQEGDAKPALQQLELKDADPRIVLERASLPCPPPRAPCLAQAPWCWGFTPGSESLQPQPEQLALNHSSYP